MAAKVKSYNLNVTEVPVSDFAIYYFLSSSIKIFKSAFQTLFRRWRRIRYKIFCSSFKNVRIRKRIGAREKRKSSSNWFQAICRHCGYPKRFDNPFFIFLGTLKSIIHFNVFANDLFLTLQKMSSWYFKGDKWKCLFAAPVFFYNLTNKYFRMQNVHAQCWPTWWKYSKEFDKLGSQKGNSKLSRSIEKSLQSDNRISLRLC